MPGTLSSCFTCMNSFNSQQTYSVDATVIIPTLQRKQRG